MATLLPALNQRCSAQVLYEESPLHAQEIIDALSSYPIVTNHLRHMAYTLRDRNEGPGPMEQSRMARRWVNLLVMVAILITLAQHIAVLSRPFNYQHAWGVAGAALHARTFRSLGMFHLRFAPIHNNPPYG